MNQVDSVIEFAIFRNIEISLQGGGMTQPCTRGRINRLKPTIFAEPRKNGHPYPA